MLELLRKRRSVRKYKELPVEDEKIDIMVRAALTAPSGRNLKPCEIIVVTDREDLKKLSQSRGKVSSFIGHSAVGFVVIADTSQSTTWVSDSAIVSTILQLTGEDLGLKSCWIHAEDRIADDGSNMEENVKRILRIPENYRVHSLISMGYPDEDKAPHDLDNLEFNRVHYGKF